MPDADSAIVSEAEISRWSFFDKLHVLVTLHDNVWAIVHSLGWEAEVLAANLSPWALMVASWDLLH